MTIADLNALAGPLGYALFPPLVVDRVSWDRARLIWTQHFEWAKHFGALAEAAVLAEQEL